MRRVTTKCITLAVLVLVLALQTVTVLASVSGWTRIYEGVEYATGTKTSPRLMRAYALRISLQNPDVSFLATPSNGGSPYETNMQTTPTFRSTYGLEAAINANFFVSHSPYAEVEGLLISNGTTVSLDQASRQSQLRITAEKLATITGSGGNPSGIHTAVAGDAYHLMNGTALGDNSWTAPRTSVGVSQDGKYLIMCVVDGRQPGYSDGATILDMSYWMLDFGAYNAMNLDGGGSSCICTAAQGVLNSPSDGAPRSVGANLGVNSTSFNAHGPSAVCWGFNRIDIVSRGSGNHVFHKYFDGYSWSNWSDLGGYTLDSPAICSWGPGRLDVFYRGTDNHIWHRYWNGSTWSASWTDKGGDFTSAPAAVAWGEGRIDLFARGTNNHIMHRYWNGSAWTSWTDKGGYADSAPAACSWGPMRLDVFYKGTNNHIMHRYFDDSGWSADWTDKGGSMTSAPAAVAWAENRIDVVARGTNNNIMHRYFSSSGWSADWTDKGGDSAGVPAICSWGEGRLDLFIRGQDDVLYHQDFTMSNGWSGWFSMGSYF